MQSISILYTFLYDFNVLSTHNRRHALFIFFPLFIFPLSFLRLASKLPGNFSVLFRSASSKLPVPRQEMFPVNCDLF